MTTQVLILNHQLTLTVTLKQALERTGLYSAHPFTTADTAIEYLRAHPQQVALVDLDLPGIRGDELIARLREVQPDLPIIASPLLDRNTTSQLNLQGTLKANFSARDVLPLLEEYNAPAEEQQDAPQLIDRPETAPSLRTRLLNNPTRDAGATRSIEMPEERQPIATEGFNTAPNKPAPPAVIPKMATTDSLGDLPLDRPGTNRLTDVLDQMADDDYGPDEPLRDMDAAGDAAAPAPDAPHSDLLSRLDLSSIPPVEPPTTDQRFTDLVNSMRRGGDDPRKNLPQRSQPFVDFILTGGMDTLLTEIERSKGSTQPIDAKTAFEQLAAEEPPMPTLEESGTVGDLMSGVSDPGFRNVLALLSGDQPESPAGEGEADGAPEMSPDEIESAFSSYFQSNEPPRVPTAPLTPKTAPLKTATAPLQPPTAPEERTPARMILETALDESTPIDSFSLENLIASIDQQLPEHRPNVQPLPSWVRESDVNFIFTQPQIAEPDFLAGNTALFAPTDDPDFAFANTQPSSGALPETGAYDFVTDSYEMSARTQPIAGRAEPLPEIAAPNAEEATPAHGQPLAEDATQTFERPAELPVLRPAVEASWLDLDMIDELNLLEDYEQETVPHRIGEQPLDPRFERLLNMGDLDEESSTPLPPRPVRKPARPAVPPPAPVEPLPAHAEEPTGPLEPTPAYAEEPAEWPESIPAYEEPQPPERLPDLLPEADEAAEQPAYEPVYEAASAMPVAEAPIEDEQISQLALSLTQASLELTADATLLTRGRDVVAAAGALAPEDIVELRRVVKDDWEAGGDDARMRFITLPGSGKDYLAYSRRTIDDLTLTMLFSGARPLRDIRRQERRLLEALEAVPEKPAPVPTTAPEPEPRPVTPRTITPVARPTTPAVTPVPAAALSDEVETVTRTPYAAVWLVRDPNRRLGESVTRAISTGLRAQLGAQSWTVQDLAAQDEFVYVRADVPGETPPPEIIRDLKRRSAQIAAALDPSLPASELWADSYLIVTSGQALDDEEIQQFINFERME